MAVHKNLLEQSPLFPPCSRIYYKKKKSYSQSPVKRAISFKLSLHCTHFMHPNIHLKPGKAATKFFIMSVQIRASVYFKMQQALRIYRCHNLLLWPSSAYSAVPWLGRVSCPLITVTSTSLDLDWFYQATHPFN